MQASARQQELERLFNARKGHVPHISISDESHHVTEAIGSYYDTPSEQDIASMSLKADPRPLSFISGPSESRFTATPRSPSLTKRTGSALQNNGANSPQGSALSSRSGSADRGSPTPGEAGSPNALKRISSLGTEQSSNGSTTSLSRHNSTDTAVQPFPLNDIDYESSPAAVAQELSNLQAIRRMSMNVDTADPDLPTFGSIGSMPSPPGHSTSEDDPSKLFWVPARLHPELAPKEFKTFVEERVDKIRRRSGDGDSLSPDSLDRADSDGGLRRKKSMLSHSIDTRGNYEDGAERLERKRSKGMQVEGQASIANLHDLETLVNDPAQLVSRLSLDQQRTSEDSGSEAAEGVILPSMHPTLKRSTHTTYRKGSLRKGQRQPYSKRALSRQADVDDDMPTAESISADPPILGLTRVQTEPIPEPQESYDEIPASSSRHRQVHASNSLEDFTRERSHSDERREQAQPQFEPRSSSFERPPQPLGQHPVNPRIEQQEQPQRQQQQPQQPVRQFQSRLASGGRTTAQLPGYNNPNPLPHIIETLADGTKVPVGPLASQTQQFPERKSSFDHQRPQRGAHTRPVPGRQQNAPSSTLDDISSNPAMVPGQGAARTDALTMVPTFDEKKPEKKEGGRKSSWKWVFGNDDDDKKASSKKSAGYPFDDNASIKSSKSTKSSKQDKARLDVLQNSIDSNNARPRESLVLNRDEFRIEDDRKTSKKSTDSARKEKDSSLLSAIFGGKKKTLDVDVKDKRRKNDRPLSPEPPPRLLKADIDYNWTRFSILEERAIYRMAHIKLANPRRALHSQVLLSNFMYSYLAKVQMMHPQMQIPASQQQKMQMEQQRQQQQQKQDAQPSEYQEYQRWQEQQAAQDNATDTQHQYEQSYDTGVAQSSYEHDEHAAYDEQRSSDEQHADWQDQQQQQHQDAYGQAVHMNGKTSSRAERERDYSVASGQDYAGYSPTDHHHNNYGDEHLWDGEEESEELW